MDRLTEEMKSVFKVRTATTNMNLAPFLGKSVRYKRELLTPEFIRSHGRIVIDEIFTIKEVQVDYYGEDVLRGYSEDDNFGRCIKPEHVEIIEK